MEFKGLGKQSTQMLWNKIKTVLFNKSVTDVSISGKTVTITKGDGTSTTQTTQDTTYSDMKGATSSAAGSHGLAPAPAAGAANRYLRSDGTWAVPPNDNTTYNDATQTAHGLMTAADKKKLDGIAENANNYSHPTSSGYRHIPAGGSSGKILRWSADGTAVWGDDKDTTYSRFTSANDGLVPAPNGSGDILLSTGIWGSINLEQGENAQLGKTIDLTIDDISYGGVNIPYASANVNGLATTAMYTKLANLPTASQLSDTYAKKSDVTGVYKPKGSVADASKLPTSGQIVGDVWSIESDSEFGPAGMNVVWTKDGKWDNLGGIVEVEELTQADIDEICV